MAWIDPGRSCRETYYSIAVVAVAAATHRGLMSLLATWYDRCQTNRHRQIN